MKYNCSVVLPIKDEPIKYLLEWIEWNLYIGVDHFYIYDDDSLHDLASILKPYSKYITMYSGLFRGQVKRQQLFYEYCIEKYKYESKWMAFIDCDEYIVLPKGVHLKNFLEKFEDHAGIMLFWKEFGTSGHKTTPKGLVIENFTKFRPKERTGVYPTKTIAQPKYIDKFVNVHYFEYTNGRFAVTPEGYRMSSHCLHKEDVDKVVFDSYVLNHYVTKSKSDLKSKIERGSAMVGEMREKKVTKLRRLDEGCVAEETQIQEHLKPFKRFRNSTRMTAARKSSALIKNRLTDKSFESRGFNKLFCVGLSKTGTSSLHKALHLLGLKGIHHPKPNQYLNLKSTDFLCDVPVSTRYKTLDILYPESKFILTTRDVNAWLKSAESHFSKGQIPSPDDLRFHYRMETYGIHYFDPDTYRNVYNSHIAEVLQYFKDRKDDLLILDVSEQDKWSKICEFLNVDKPKNEYPHSNVGSYSKAR